MAQTKKPKTFLFVYSVHGVHPSNVANVAIEAASKKEAYEIFTDRVEKMKEELRDAIVVVQNIIEL